MVPRVPQSSLYSHKHIPPESKHENERLTKSRADAPSSSVCPVKQNRRSRCSQWRLKYIWSALSFPLSPCLTHTAYSPLIWVLMPDTGSKRSRLVHTHPSAHVPRSPLLSVPHCTHRVSNRKAFRELFLQPEPAGGRTTRPHSSCPK